MHDTVEGLLPITGYIRSQLPQVMHDKIEGLHPITGYIKSQLSRENLKLTSSPTGSFLFYLICLVKLFVKLTRFVLKSDVE